MSDADVNVSVVAVTAAVGAIVLLLVMLCGLIRRQDDKSEEDKQEDEVKDTQPPQKQQMKKKVKPPARKKNEKFMFTHPWLAGSLKNHSSPVVGLDISPNGKYLVSCAEDRSVLVWNVKDFKKKEHKSSRANIELDHATRVRFSPDSKAFIALMFNANALRVIKFGRKDDGTLGNFQQAVDFPKGHEVEVIDIGISSNAKFMMTCARDTIIKIWDLKGELLSVIDTHQMNNSHGAVSPCGRFVASSGFTPDVKVWEVCFDKGGNFKEVIRAFELKGHSAGVYHFAFSGDSHRMATVSKDGTWKLWNTNVEYRKFQDAKLLSTGKCTHQGMKSLIALSPDGSAVAVASNTHISMYNALTTECQQEIEDAHSLPIQCLEYDPFGQYLVSSGDKNINIFHNVVGFRAHIADLEEKLGNATGQAHIERLQQQITETKEKLKEAGSS